MRVLSYRPFCPCGGRQAGLLLSLSRLNHWLPRGQAHPEIMQGTADFHHQIADTLLPQPDPVFDDATALDTAVDMFDAQPALGERLICRLLLPCQLLAAWFLGRHEDLHLGERKRQEAQILQEPASSGQGRGCGLGNRLIMDAAAVGVAQQEDREEGIDEQDIFDRVVLFLPALTVRLFRRVLGADDAPFGPVMGTRGDTDAAAGMAPPGAGSSSSGTTTVAVVVSATPNRCARAVREWAGASPRARSAASSAGKRT
jgi:hypothetical protein